MTKQNQVYSLLSCPPCSCPWTLLQGQKWRTCLKNTVYSLAAICQRFTEWGLFCRSVSLRRAPCTENTNPFMVSGSSFPWQKIPQNKSARWNKGRGREPHLLCHTALQDWAESSQSSWAWWQSASRLTSPHGHPFFLLLQRPTYPSVVTKTALSTHVSARWHKQTHIQSFRNERAWEMQ